MVYMIVLVVGTVVKMDDLENENEVIVLVTILEDDGSHKGSGTSTSFADFFDLESGADEAEDIIFPDDSIGVVHHRRQEICVSQGLPFYQGAGKRRRGYFVVSGLLSTED